MKGKLILLLIGIFLMGNIGTGYADEINAEQAPEDMAENVITLEQAKELAAENCRELTKYEISTEIAKYQFYQADDQYDDANNEMDIFMNRLNNWNQKYADLQADLQEELNQTEPDEDKIEDIQDQMESIQADMDNTWDEIDQKSDSVQSLLDKKRDAENSYNQAIIDQDNYQEKLDFLVEDLYTTILKQEKIREIYHKERKLKEYQLRLEKVKLSLGRSSQSEIDQLTIDLDNTDQKIDELNNAIKVAKGNLNDMMGREFDSPLTLTSFEISTTADIPDYDILLVRATNAYDKFDEIKRDIEERKDDLDYADDSNYQKELLELQIDQKELELKDEKYQLVENINNLISDVTAKQKNYQISLSNYERAQQDYEWNKKRFEMGRISKLDLMQSELDYLYAQNEKISAEYDFYLAQRSLNLAENGIF